MRYQTHVVALPQPRKAWVATKDGSTTEIEVIAIATLFDVSEYAEDDRFDPLTEAQIFEYSSTRYLAWAPEGPWDEPWLDGTNLFFSQSDALESARQLKKLEDHRNA